MKSPMGASYFDELCPVGSQARKDADRYWGADDDGFCQCEGQDPGAAGYVCDECKREIPEAKIIGDFLEDEQ